MSYCTSDPDNKFSHQIPPPSGWSNPRKPLVQPKIRPHSTTGAWRPSDTAEETQLLKSALLPVILSLGCELPPLDYPFDLLYLCTSEHLESVYVPLILTWKFQHFPEEKSITQAGKMHPTQPPPLSLSPLSCPPLSFPSYCSLPPSLRGKKG